MAIRASMRSLWGFGLLRVALNIELCEQEEKGEDVSSVDDDDAGRVARAPAGTEQKRSRARRQNEARRSVGRE